VVKFAVCLAKKWLIHYCFAKFLCSFKMFRFVFGSSIFKSLYIEKSPFHFNYLYHLIQSSLYFPKKSYFIGVCFNRLEFGWSCLPNLQYFNLDNVFDLVQFFLLRYLKYFWNWEKSQAFNNFNLLGKAVQELHFQIFTQGFIHCAQLIHFQINHFCLKNLYYSCFHDTILSFRLQNQFVYFSKFVLIFFYFYFSS
jgi:hypothetical protein